MFNQARNSWLLDLQSFSLLRNEERKSLLQSQGREVFDFGIGDPQEETPEFIREALLKNVTPTSQYPSAIGSLELRTACASWLNRRFGLDLRPQGQVIATNGSKEAVFHVPQILLNAATRRRVIVFPEPGYPVYKSSTILAGGIPYELPLRPELGYVFNPLDVPAPLLDQVAAVWVCYPHNPTGAMVTLKQMEDIYRWAIAHDIVLLSDECYVDMYFPGTDAPSSFLTVARENGYKNLLSFFSLSKRSGMTGYRSGFVAGDTDLVGLFAKFRPNAWLGTPDFVQKAAVTAWGEDEHVRLRNGIFAEKRKLVEGFFQKAGIKFLPSSATFYVWAQVPNLKTLPPGDGEAFADALAKATGIIVTPGDAFGASCRNWFRMALVPTAARIESCLRLWQQAMEKGELV